MKTLYIENGHYLDYFFYWEKHKPNKVYLQQPIKGEWIKITYAQAGVIIRKIAKYLISIGIKKGDNIGIVSKNCSEWILADLAICYINAVSVPYYANLNKDALKPLIEKSDLKAIFVGKIETWNSIKESIPDELQIITMLNYPMHNDIDRGKKWKDILKEFNPDDIDYNPVKLDDVWTIIFTSGTTGTPKGAVLTNKNLATLIKFEVKDHIIGLSVDYSLDFLNLFTILPLNHIAERICGEIFGIVYGGRNSFTENIDSFLSDIRYVQPNFIFGVPHLWSKLQLGVLGSISPKKLNTLLKIPIVSSIVKRKIKKKLGLNKLQLAITAAAPISIELKEWYYKLGIELREVYGMTEVCGPTVVMPKNDRTEGVVGKVIKGMELKIAPITKEVLILGPLVMEGYYKNKELTDNVIIDGWMHTGDIGKIDENGYLYIEGRISDTFKTAKGKFLSPAPIERIMNNDENIEILVVIGIGIPQPIAFVKLSDSGKEKDVNHIKNVFTTLLKDVNSQLLNYQRINKIVVIEDEWNMDNNILTPTLKIKRKEVDAKYRNHYQTWFNLKPKVIWQNEINS